MSWCQNLLITWITDILELILFLAIHKDWKIYKYVLYIASISIINKYKVQNNTLLVEVKYIIF